MPAPKLHLQTPVFENPAINQRLNKKIYLKMECYQPVGSFKIRGIGALCQEAVQSGVDHLVCSSGGNAGYAAAAPGPGPGEIHSGATSDPPWQNGRSLGNRGAEKKRSPGYALEDGSGELLGP